MENLYKMGSGFLAGSILDLDREMSDDEYFALSSIKYSDAVEKAMRTDEYMETLSEMMSESVEDEEQPTPDQVMTYAGIEPKDVLWHDKYRKLIRDVIGEEPNIPIDGDTLYTISAGLSDLDKAALIHMINTDGEYNATGMTKMWNGYAFDDDNVFIGNTGMCFENDEFLLHAYDWGETYYGGGNVANFWHKQTGVVIDWYKYIGRGVCVNHKAFDCLYNGKFHTVIEACIQSLRD